MSIIMTVESRSSLRVVRSSEYNGPLSEPLYQWTENHRHLKVLPELRHGGSGRGRIGRSLQATMVSSGYYHVQVTQAYKMVE